MSWQNRAAQCFALHSSLAEDDGREEQKNTCRVSYASIGGFQSKLDPYTFLPLREGTIYFLAVPA